MWVDTIRSGRGAVQFLMGNGVVVQGSTKERGSSEKALPQDCPKALHSVKKRKTRFLRSWSPRTYLSNTNFDFYSFSVFQTSHIASCFLTSPTFGQNVLVKQCFSSRDMRQDMSLLNNTDEKWRRRSESTSPIALLFLAKSTVLDTRKLAHPQWTRFAILLMCPNITK